MFLYVQLHQQTFSGGTRGHSHGIETLNVIQDGFHLGRRKSVFDGNLLGRGLQVALRVQVADDDFANGLLRCCNWLRPEP